LAQKAGWLIKRGADYWITPVKYTRDNKSAADQVLVETGNRPRLGTPSRYYFDRAERPNGKQFSVDRELIQQFRDQLTEEQKSLLKKRGSDESLNKPVPVFYVLDEKGKVWFLGLPKYFRIPYERSPADLVGQASGLDFAAALFGTVSGKARRGRVAVGAARLEKWEPMESAVATLGQPQATCVAHYLRQDPDQLRVMKNNSGRINPKTLTTYNSDEPRLSGRKWYWHRDWAPTENPKGNENTDAELFPVKAGAEGRFNIVLDGLSLEELGAVLMALEPFPGAAHKLGMGKPLGLGSVRLTVEELRLGSERDRYVSISDRLAGRAEAEAELKSRARLAFQEHILGQLKEQGAGAASFDDLPAIKTLRVMMDYEGRPKNEATAYLSIEEPNRQGVTYKTKAPLKTPEHIKRESGRRPD
jgi:CRISPR-associated protein (TIGR03986 family)